jgi:DNA-binding LacI/PurR family transcriptional regulator
MAARKLAEHGYKRPAMVCEKLIAFGKSYIPYERRFEGFRDACGKFGLEFCEASAFWTSGENYKRIVQLVKTAGTIANGHFDSVFLHTDPQVDFVFEALVEEKSVPGEIGLVTVNSFDKAVEHNPPVSSVSHGTQEVAETLIEQIKYILETGDSNIGEVMVKPGFHEGATL